MADLRSDFKWAATPEWVLFHPDLSDRAVRLFGIIGRHANGMTDEAFPTRKTLAKECKNCSPDSIDRAVKELQAVGALVVEKRWTEEGDPTSNLYTLMYAPVQMGGRKAAGTSSRKAAGTGSRQAAAQTTANTNDSPSNELAVAAEEPTFALMVETAAGPPEHWEETKTAWVFKAPTGRRDLLFEAIRYVAGWDDKELTESAGGWIGRSAKELRAIGATPAEVVTHARHYFMEYGHRPQPTALVTHWNATSEPPPPRIDRRTLEKAQAAAMREQGREARARGSR